MPGRYECYECKHSFFSDEEPCVEINGHLYCTCCADTEENRLAEEEDSEFPPKFSESKERKFLE